MGKDGSEVETVAECEVKANNNMKRTGYNSGK